eukprot:TRINITY_DN961_c0_g1_i1.p1 TRINITY_DN961_c0_g1~~TRINITY_DN961_c0_g1_i1.p1  ORF type:complete len:197 (+),score=56.98 TRINITY_DN961_c0_g1_i1:466-1056(+)
MRMDQQQDIPTARDLLLSLSEQELSDIIWKYGEDRFSRAIAHGIKTAIKSGVDIDTTQKLASLIREVRPMQKQKKHSPKLIDPATRTFQALRICVNKELEELEKVLSVCESLLNPGGRIAIISFHPLEDKMVKEFFQQKSSTSEKDHQNNKIYKGPTFNQVTNKVIVPSESELEQNVRSRSAKLRCVQRTFHPLHT